MLMLYSKILPMYGRVYNKSKYNTRVAKIVGGIVCVLHYYQNTSSYIVILKNIHIFPEI